MVGALTDVRTDGRTDRQTDTQNFRGYNIIPRHFLVAGHNKKAFCLYVLCGVVVNVFAYHLKGTMFES